MKNSSPIKRLPWPKIIFGLLLLTFGLVLFLEKNKSLSVLARANWFFAIAAFLATGVSLVLAAEAYTLLNILFGLSTERKKLFIIGVVTIAFNNLLTLGGTVGYSLRVMLLKNEKDKGSHIMAASLFFSYLNFLVILFFSAFSVAYALLTGMIAARFAPAFQAALMIFAVFFLALTFFLFSKKIRQKLFSSIAWLVHALIKIDIQVSLKNTSQALDNGLALSKKRPGDFVRMLATFLADWLLCLLIFEFCFMAFGFTFSFMALMAGFFLSVIAGLVSFIPGGLGVQDLSEVAIYHILGAPLPVAVAASVLFRIIYYLVPFLVSLGLYHRLISQEKSGRVSGFFGTSCKDNVHRPKTMSRKILGGMAKIMLGITIFLVSIFFAATIWYKVNPDQFTDDIRIFPFWPDRLIDTIRFFPNYNPFGKQYDSDLLKANALAADTASQTRLQQGSLVVKTILQMAPGKSREVLLYLPKGYDPNDKSQHYPVLYLLHGSPGEASDWLYHGRAQQTLDQRIADGSIAPFIAVFPDGNGSNNVDTQYINSALGPNEDFIAKTVVNYVDNNFPTIPDAGHRAIGGLSEGGFGALNIALKHQDVFGYAISLSGYGELPITPLTKSFITSKQIVQENSPIDYIPTLKDNTTRVIMITDKRSADLADGNNVLTLLKNKDFQADLIPFPGEHNWPFWIKHLPAGITWLGQYWKKS